jgi:DNA-binding NtrC family response regulator
VFVLERSMKKNQTILVVDDVSENVRSYIEILTDLDFQAISSGDADSALALIRSEPAIDLVITDYRMPGRSGLEFMEELRILRPELPVIMITAYADIETYLQAFSLGAFEFINKPIKKMELEIIVLRALANYNDRMRPQGKDPYEQPSSH